MEPSLSRPIKPKTVQKRKGSKESKWIKIVLISIAVVYLSLLLFVPLIAIFIKAFEQGVDVYLAAITESDALSAIKLTLLVAVIVVPLNTIFGVAAAWL
ncbi:MAG TPA: sulfate ABC transporter permease subunit CysW, partial [Bacillus sp. (in: firmicutes)]